MTVLFDGSFDGFLSVVYAVYYEKIAPTSIQPEGMEQLALGAPPRFIEADSERAARVYKAVREKISEDSAYYIYNAFHSYNENRMMAILNYIRLGFSVGQMVDSHLHEDFVRLVQGLSRNVWKEAHLLMGFCRFAETKQNAFYCKITPKNDVLSHLAEHFCQRLMNQAWVIHDKRRNKAAIYDGNSYVIAAVPPNDATVIYADGEEETQELWTTFFNTLAIKERKNKKLQRQMCPLYFRGNMLEFKI
ncbi:MAG: TIGR03915 family putative DNA repair protein [Clostridiales bacterium]|jgi:probable DNA metabolism protein|nr:TIGR03915 family putative DNA repair protein [Clostridiales bacterium]